MKKWIYIILSRIVIKPLLRLINGSCSKEATVVGKQQPEQRSLLPTDTEYQQNSYLRWHISTGSIFDEFRQVVWRWLIECNCTCEIIQKNMIKTIQRQQSMNTSNNLIAKIIHLLLCFYWIFFLLDWKIHFIQLIFAYF